MQLFLDSADPQHVRTALEWGRIDGVTTNPSLVASLGRPYRDLIAEILVLQPGPLSLEVTATGYVDILSQARRLAALSRHVVVKIPCTAEGLQAVRTLSTERIKTNVTLIFSVSQALLAARAGATYASVFVGRMEDMIESSGDELLAKVRTAFDEYVVATKLLAASIRTAEQFEEALVIGADCISVPFHVLEGLVKHPLTDSGLQRFLDDWNRSGLEFPV